MDWKAIKQLAFGDLKLHPAEFWALTQSDLSDLVEGLIYRMQKEQRSLTRQIPVTKKHSRKPKTREEAKAMFEKLKGRFS